MKKSIETTNRFPLEQPTKTLLRQKIDEEILLNIIQKLNTDNIITIKRSNKITEEIIVATHIRQGARV